MPTVPVYGNQKVSTALLPSARRSAAATPQSEGVGAWNAVAELGQVAHGIGAELLRKEQERQDQDALTTAERQLNELELQVLSSPDKGVLRVKGKDALAAKGPALHSFDEQLGMIESNLNDRQKRAFQPRRDRRRLEVASQIDNHGMRELEAHETNEAKALIQSSIDTAVQNATNPRRIAEAFDSIDRVIEVHGNVLGITGDEARKAFRAGVRSKVHEGVLEGLLARGLDIQAREYFDEVRSQLSADALPRLEKQVTESASDLLGLRAADEIWSAHAPVDDKSPISLDVMETAARARFAEDPRTLKVVIAELRTRKQGVDVGRKERDDARDDGLWTSIMQGAPLATVMRSREFIQSTGEVKNRITEYYRRQAEHAESLAASRESRAAARENRAYTAQLRQQNQLEINGWAKYFELSDPQVLSTLSTADIRKQLPELGHDHVNRLLNDREQLVKSSAAVRNATVDDSIVKDALRDAGQAYVDKPTSTAQKANIGNFKVAVLEEIAKRQIATKAPLTWEEKREIASELAGRKVMVDDWFSDSEVIAATVKADDRKAVYVPLDQIDATSGAYKQALNYLRGTSAAAAKLTDAQLRTQYKARIEKAIGRARTGGSREEIENALKGVD